MLNFYGVCLKREKKKKKYFQGSPKSEQKVQVPAARLASQVPDGGLHPAAAYTHSSFISINSPVRVNGAKAKCVCKCGGSPQTGANGNRQFWESPSSSAPLPIQNKLLLGFFLGSFKLIILGRVLGLGFILFKRVVGRKQTKKFFNLFSWHFFVQCLIQRGAEELPLIGAALRNRALDPDGYQHFIPGPGDEGLLSYV